VASPPLPRDSIQTLCINCCRIAKEKGIFWVKWCKNRSSKFSCLHGHYWLSFFFLLCCLFLPFFKMSAPVRCFFSFILALKKLHRTFTIHSVTGLKNLDYFSLHFFFKNYSKFDTYLPEYKILIHKMKEALFLAPQKFSLKVSNSTFSFKSNCLGANPHIAQVPYAKISILRSSICCNVNSSILRMSTVWAQAWENFWVKKILGKNFIRVLNYGELP